MIRLSFRSTLGVAILAGLLAGVVVGLFHLVATEPVLQQAIDLEARQHHTTRADAAPAIISRGWQHVGLIIGFVLYGLTWGMLLGVLVWLLRSHLQGHRWRWQVLGLVFVAYWSLGLFPHLKYPANPPGIGDPATIEARQSAYLTLLGFAVLGTLLISIVYRDLGRLSDPWRWQSVRSVLLLVCYGGYMAGLSLALPAQRDPISLPSALVAQFRWLSLVGITLFWIVLGCTFVILIHRKIRSARLAARQLV